jgi:hypothetical protein
MASLHNLKPERVIKASEKAGGRIRHKKGS